MTRVTLFLNGFTILGLKL